MTFKKPLKKAYPHRKPRPKTDWDDPTDKDMWILDMSVKPMSEWKFVKVTEK